MIRGAGALAAGVVLLPLLAGSARAEPARRVSLSLDDCARERADLVEVEALLRTELAGGGEPLALVLDEDGVDAALTLRLACVAGEEAFSASLALPDRPAAAALFDLEDARGRMRGRTLALALAERIREELRAPPPPGLLLRGSPSPSEEARGGVAVEDGGKLAASGYTALVMGVVGAATVIGATGAMGYGAGAPDRFNERIAGAVLYAVAGSALVGGAASFGVWVKARRRAAGARAVLAPSFGDRGAGVAVIGEF